MAWHRTRVDSGFLLCYLKSGACCFSIILHLITVSEPQTWLPTVGLSTIDPYGPYSFEDSSVASSSRGAGCNTESHGDDDDTVSLSQTYNCNYLQLQRFKYKQEARCHLRSWGGTTMTWSELLTQETRQLQKSNSWSLCLRTVTPSGCQ